MGIVSPFPQIRHQFLLYFDTTVQILLDSILEIVIKNPDQASIHIHYPLFESELFLIVSFLRSVITLEPFKGLKIKCNIKT